MCEKGGMQMNQIIQRLSEVETAASSIIEEAGAKKKQMAKDQDARIAAFEKQVHEETQKKSALSRQSLKKRSLKNLKLRRRSLKNSYVKAKSSRSIRSRLSNRVRSIFSPQNMMLWGIS